MDKDWKLSRFRGSLAVLEIVVALFLVQNFGLCSSLNDEGLALLRFKERVVSDPFGALSDWKYDGGEVNPCSWFGVECSDGQVVVLNLENLCLGGTLALELGQLAYIKSILLRNNAFSGVIPKGIGELKELEVLDLGFNNFSGPLPSDLGSNLSLTILLLDNNGLLDGFSPEIQKLQMLSELLVDENQLSGLAKELSCNQGPNEWKLHQAKSPSRRRAQAVANPPKGSEFSLTPTIEPTSKHTPVPSPSQSPGSSAPKPSTPLPVPKPTLPSPPTASNSPAPASSPKLSETKKSFWEKHRAPILAGVIGAPTFIIFSILVYLCINNKVANVRPWTTGLSGQLQKALVTGLPKLKRSELETACEDFSNVLGSSPIGTLYKGTLSSGVEIAVASVASATAKDWSENLEVQFLKKIDTLSKVNHKNFVNLIGYCKEEEPFTRMMVFEYAPMGTLFEHLHIREAEHLDWTMRLRIAMGMAYCLDYMHRQEPPVAHNNLTSSATRLTEDYAAKLSEFSFWNEIAEAPMKSPDLKLSNTQSVSPESNVYSFGVILFEMATGRLPYSVDNSSLEDWASDYLRGDQPLKDMVDPTLSSFQENQLEQIGSVIKACVHPDRRQRPSMREVCMRLREITEITPDGATPRLSPLWWAELELMSTEAI
ncbi:hypothetical protein UlMin_043136 [Ulmus minor]